MIGRLLRKLADRFEPTPQPAPPPPVAPIRREVPTYYEFHDGISRRVVRTLDAWNRVNFAELFALVQLLGNRPEPGDQDAAAEWFRGTERLAEIGAEALEIDPAVVSTADTITAFAGFLKTVSANLPSIPASR